MASITIQINDIETEAEDSTEALIEQIVAFALAEYGIKYEGLVSAHRETVPIKKEPLEKFWAVFDGLADSIYSDGYSEQISRLDELREAMEVGGKNVPQEGADAPVSVRELAEDMENTIDTIDANRPEDPETVSYALEDLQKQVGELKSLDPNSTTND